MTCGAPLGLSPAGGGVVCLLPPSPFYFAKATKKPAMADKGKCGLPCTTRVQGENYTRFFANVKRFFR